MERLTMWYDGNHAICQNEDCDRPDCPFADPVCKRVQDIIDRLAAYEETGLEPEEIISAAYTAKIAYVLHELNAYMARIVCALHELNAYKELGPIDRLRELIQADREGRCVVLPCKIFDKVWNVAAHYQFEVVEIDLLPYGNILFRCGNKGSDDYASFFSEDLGDTFIFEEPPKRVDRVDTEATLRREQDG